jgi:hypothetical protein
VCQRLCFTCYKRLDSAQSGANRSVIGAVFMQVIIMIPAFNDILKVTQLNVEEGSSPSLHRY